MRNYSLSLVFIQLFKNLSKYFSIFCYFSSWQNFHQFSLFSHLLIHTYLKFIVIWGKTACLCVCVERAFCINTYKIRIIFLEVISFIPLRVCVLCAMKKCLQYHREYNIFVYCPIHKIIYLSHSFKGMYARREIILCVLWGNSSSVAPYIFNNICLRHRALRKYFFFLLARVALYRKKDKNL